MRHLVPIALLAALAAPVLALAAEPTDDASRGYSIETGDSTASLAKGQQGKLVLVIQAKGAWHVDPRTPLKVDLVAPAGLQLERSRLGKKDVVDPKAESPRLEAPFTAAAAGQHDVRAKLDFFVCSAEACVKQVREVTIPVTVR
jgi:hypothetical protein